MAAPIRHTCPASFVVHASTRSAISDLQPRQIGATADPKLVVEHSPSPHLPRADPSLAPSLIHRHQGYSSEEQQPPYYYLAVAQFLFICLLEVMLID
uniref:Uncharacterized protein n=1 Tax=Oryza rufipogon TaxID=4529 RepID=A0A0E0RH05_ORYRU